MVKKRVVLVVPGGVDAPGGQRVIPFLHHLVGSLADRHQVTVVAVGHDTRRGEWKLFGADVINVPVGSHSKTDIGRVVAATARAARLQGRPDVVHGFWANLPGFAAVAAAKMWRVPSVVTVCGGELASIQPISYGGGLRKGTKRLALTALNAATTATVATRWMHRHVVAAGGPATEIVPLGADPSLFAPSKVPTDVFRLVHVANLNHVKDQDLLLNAFALARRQEPRLTLTIAGDDTLGGHHQRLVEQLGIDDSVGFCGHVAHARLAPVVQGAGLHVLSSHHDAGPISVLEAALCGVPTVGTEVGHVADFANMASPAAVAVRGRNPSVLAATIVELVDDRCRRDRLATAAHEWAVEHDANYTAAAFERIYSRLTR